MINPLTLTARFNSLFPQCSQVTLTMSAFNAQSISGSVSNQLVIYKTCLAYFSDLTSEQCSHTISSPLGMKISIHFLDNILSYLHLFVSYCGYHKMAENNTSVEYNLMKILIVMAIKMKIQEIMSQ